MSTGSPVVFSDPEILAGTPVFVETRVPLQALLDYLEAGFHRERKGGMPGLEQQWSSAE